MKYIQLSRVLMNGIAGTSAMTAFSVFISYMEERNFVEPELLTKLICEWVPELKSYQAKMAAWGIHYLIGFLFVIVYGELWKHSKYKPNLQSGIVLGAASGLLGIVGWRCALKLCKSHPVVDRMGYFGHLEVAHIVFGAFAALRRG